MSMDKSEIIKMVLELYSARKEAKEYLDFYAEPNEGQKLEEYKHIIREDSVAELMVFYMENACQFTYDYGDMWEQFYDSVESNFDKTLRHIVLYDLWDKYDSRIKQCLRWASPCGWGFPDALNDMYEEMKAQNEELRKKYRNFKMPINADY